MYRIGIDVGGTFTDVTLLNSETGAYYTYKLSSTLHDQSEAIANGTKETLALYGVPVEQRVIALACATAVSRWSSWSILATAPRLQPT